MREKLRMFVHDREIGFKERIFRILCIEGLAISVFALIVAICLRESATKLVCIGTILVVMGISLLLCVKDKLTNISKIVVAGMLVLFVLPVMFFASGGFDGGAVTWLTLGIVYVFISFSGEQLLFFGSFAIVVDIICLWYAAVNPTAFAIESNGRMFESGAAVIIVGFIAGSMYMYQAHEYEIERKINNEQRKKLEKLGRSKDKFYANFSHEIRNPINAIIGLNEITLRKTNDEVTAANAHAIKSSSRLLLNLINDIMDFSQIQNSSMKLIEAPYNSNDFFTELVELVGTRAEEKKLKLKLLLDPSIPATMVGDERRLVQVVLNLLTNAIKYTIEGEVVLSASCVKAKEGHVTLKISVADTGIGIKKENLKYLFDSFSQFDRSKNSRIEGNGLGMAITKELVTLMHGEIAVDSVYTKGSTFTITVDQGYVGEEVIGKTDILSGNVALKNDAYERSFEAPGARILVVDDDELNRAILVQLLKDTKVKVDTAGDGRRALQLTMQNVYHTILVDYMMPQMDGLELMNAIRIQDGGLNRDTAIVALTGATISEETLAKYSTKFNMTLQKPIDGSRLEQCLLHCLPEEVVEYQKDTTVVIGDAVTGAFLSENKKKVKITTDCACDLDVEVASENGIAMMYLYVKTPKGRFMDTVEIDSGNLTGYLTSSKTYVKAVSASVEEYERFFGEQLEEAQEIIHLSVGAGLGESYNKACEAAESFDHVRVVDTGQVSGGLGLLALTAASWVTKGVGADKIYSDITALCEYVDTNVVLPSSDVFVQSAKMSALIGAFFNAFNFRPVMRINKSVQLFVSVMTGSDDSVIRKHISQSMIGKGRIAPGSKVIFSHVGLTHKQQELAYDMLTKYYEPENIIVQKTSVTVAGTVGDKAIGLSFYRRNKYI